MRHYEIMLLVHPNQSEQVPQMIERYKQLITEDGGIIHRLEDWGRRLLAYPIVKAYKAHYILMNIEVSQKVLDELNRGFRYNDAILRNLILTRKEAITTESVIMTEKNKENANAKDLAAKKAAQNAPAVAATPNKEGAE